MTRGESALAARRRELGGDGGAGVRVAIVDSGIAPDHPRVGAVAGGVCFRAAADGTVERGEDWHDRHGHGTACAGVVRRIAPRVELYSVRVANEDAVSTSLLLIHALRWALEHEIHLVNVSLGTPGQRHHRELAEICSEARERGLVVVAAESNANEVAYPAALDSVVAVAAAGTEGLHQFFADPGSPTRFLARGDRQRVAWIDGEERFLGGTSMGAGQITGMLALLRARYPAAGVGQLVRRLRRFAEEAGAPAAADAADEAASPAAAADAALLVSPPPIERALLYPFAKEIHSLVRFHEQLPFEIVAAMSPLGLGGSGRDAGELLGIGATGIRVETRKAELFERADTLVLGHLDRLSAVRRRDVLGSLLASALEAGLGVYSLDALDAHPRLLAEARQRGLAWSWPALEVDDEILARARALVDEPVSAPVLGVFGTRSGQGKLTAQVALRESLRAAGYAVGWLATEPQAPLFGCDAVFPMGYNARIPLLLDQWLPYLRYQLRSLCRLREPELVLVGSQSGTIPRDPHLRSQYLCLSSQLFLYATRPDAVLLTVQPQCDEEELQYTRDTIEALRILGKTRVLAVLFSDRVAEEGAGKLRRRRVRYRFLDAEERRRVAETLEAELGLPAFSPAHGEEIERAAQLVVDFFAGD